LLQQTSKAPGKLGAFFCEAVNDQKRQKGGLATIAIGQSPFSVVLPALPSITSLFNSSFQPFLSSYRLFFPSGFWPVLFSQLSFFPRLCSCFFPFFVP